MTAVAPAGTPLAGVEKAGAGVNHSPGSGVTESSTGKSGFKVKSGDT